MEQGAQRAPPVPARVRTAAYAAGGVAPLPAEDVERFFRREDIVERRRVLAGDGS